jgi:NAD(P)H-dependent flavin oxidoreductase YrpB (nitropropane dioxygenase family)
LKTAQDDQTAITNVLTGRPARAMVNRVIGELGPMAEHAPAFPLAGGALTPLAPSRRRPDQTTSHRCGPVKPRVSVESSRREN